MRDFRDKQTLRPTYYPSVERLVCAVTSAARARVFAPGASARPAWQRTLGLYADRVGVSVDDIR